MLVLLDPFHADKHEIIIYDRSRCISYLTRTGWDEALTAERFFVGVDVGTQSTKILVVDGAYGAIVGRASQSSGYIGARPVRWKERDPAVWVDTLTATLATDLRASFAVHRAYLHRFAS